jgi:hypothetical protein
MIHRRVTRSVLSSAAALVIGVVACACSSAGSEEKSSSPVTACDAPEMVPMAVQTGCDVAVATYAAGMAQKGTSGALTFQIVSVNGGSIETNLDSWTIKVTDANCEPVDGLALTIRMWMPQHSHGWTAATATGAGGGVYDIGNMDFFMNGYWTVTITATGSSTPDAGSSAALSDSTVFSFCLDN